MTYPNKILQAFKASDTRIIVHLKYCEDTWEYTVNVYHRDGTETLVKASHSLSTVLREFAETIAQFTGGFTVWRPL